MLLVRLVPRAGGPRRLALLALLFVAWGAGSQEPPTDAVVLLEFAPRDGTRFIERIETTRERRVEGLAPRVDTSISENSISIRRTPDGYVVEATPLSLAMTRNGRSVTDPIAELLMDVVVRYRVDSAGRIETVEGYEGLLERAAGIMPPGALAALTPVLSADALAARDTAEWNGRIADFVFAEARVGEAIEGEERSTLPDGTETRYKTVTWFPGFEPCPAGECLRVEQIYDSDEEELGRRRRLATEGSEEADAAGRSSWASAPRVSGRATRLIDPTTLLIYSESSSRTITVELNTPGAGRAPTEIREERRYGYEYSPE